MRKRVCVVLILVLCAAVAAPVAATPNGPNLVAIWHKGKIIEVSLVASWVHRLLHGDSLVEGPCVPPCAPI